MIYFDTVTCKKIRKMETFAVNFIFSAVNSLYRGSTRKVYNVKSENYGKSFHFKKGVLNNTNE